MQGKLGTNIARYSISSRPSTKRQCTAVGSFQKPTFNFDHLQCQSNAWGQIWTPHVHNTSSRGLPLLPLFRHSSPTSYLAALPPYNLSTYNLEHCWNGLNIALRGSSRAITSFESTSSGIEHVRMSGVGFIAVVDIV